MAVSIGLLIVLMSYFRYDIPLTQPDNGTSPTPAARLTANRIGDFVATCGGGRSYPGNPTYASGKAGVHPGVMLVNKVARSYMLEASTSTYRSGWLLDDAGDSATVEIVYCVERIDATPALKECRAIDPSGAALTVSLHQTTYRVRVLEAKTAKTFAEHTMKSASTDCPSRIITPDQGGPRDFYSDIDQKKLDELVKAFAVTTPSG